MHRHLIQPYGGRLVNLLVDTQEASSLQGSSSTWTSWDLTPKQLCDLELLLNGGFSPLEGFMVREDYEGVCSSMRLHDGTFWPVPVTLDVSEETAGKLKLGEKLALRDPEGVMLAVLDVEDVWQPDKMREAEAIFGTRSEGHPGVSNLLHGTHSRYIGGRLQGIQLPEHFDFRPLRLSPLELRNEFVLLGWRRVIAFQTKSLIHRADYELTMKAVRDVEANLLIHPIVDKIRLEDIEHYTRVRSYQALLRRYPKHTVKLSLLPLALRYAGPKETLLNAIVSRNYGCTHLIVRKDQAGYERMRPDPHGTEPSEAQRLLTENGAEVGVEMVPAIELVYVADHDAYEAAEKVPQEASLLSLSEKELRQRLSTGREIPRWFTFPEVAEELKKAHPPRHRQGFTVFFTGLSGAGKSTLAKALEVKLFEMGGRPVTLLDGDIVRKNLSSELGFTKEHRDINIRRIGFVASEITKNGGIALCAPIAPYNAVRMEVRSLIEPLGGFILIYVSTPIDVCEKRDRKGLYAKARAGLIQEFTGVSDPYEPPVDADMVIDTSDISPDEAAQEILLHLEHERYISGNSHRDGVR